MTDGYIVPIHKKGSTSNVNNFRGITLLSTLSKLFTRILNNRLTNWAESYHVYIEAQAGFRSNMSTVDNIFALHGILTHLINKGEKLYCAFVDFTKAFDYIVRDIIWYKLIKLGINGKILNVIKSMYNNVKSKIKLNNTPSDEFNSYLGVRQGESLSPFLFAMYLNDLELELSTNGCHGIDIGTFKIFLLLYADDIILFADSPEELQNKLDALKDYCFRWKLTVNTDKTKIIVFRKGGILPRNLSFHFGDSTISIVNKFSYLGVVFSSGGSFSECQSTLAGQAQKAIFKLNKYLYSFINISPKHVLDLFDKLVTPILNYGSEVWGFCQAKQIERVHMQFCKYLLGVKTSTQNDFIFGELGRIDYRTRRLYILIRYWLKVVTSNNTKYINLIYKMMINDLELRPNKQNWASLIKSTLGMLGYHYVWQAQGVGNSKAFLSVLKQRLSDNFQQNWHERLSNSTRATFYLNISSFNFQSYLNIVNIKKFRQALTKLRVSSHRLEIEAGRWTKPQITPRENRLCKQCNLLEDEFHFLFECTLYSNIRQQHIKPYFTRRISMHKAIELCKTENSSSLKNLATYIFNGFKIRDAILYS